MIHFSVAITEIHEFFKKLKTVKTLILSNGVLVWLEVKFNHKLVSRFEKYTDISIIGDGSLRPQWWAKNGSSVTADHTWQYRM